MTDTKKPKAPRKKSTPKKKGGDKKRIKKPLGKAKGGGGGKGSQGWRSSSKKHVFGAMAPIPKPEGRPTSYRPEFTGQAYKLALLGLTDSEMAEYFEVCESTFHNWKHDYPEFLESIVEGKVRADANVAEKLYARTQGTSWEEEIPTKVRREYYKDGKKFVEEDVIITKVMRFVPPDVKAQEIWLRNRRTLKSKGKSMDWNEGATVELANKPGETFEVTVHDALIKEQVKKLHEEY